MQHYQKYSFDKFCSKYDVRNKVILEIGSDYWTPGIKVVEAFKEKNANFVIGITNQYRPDRLKNHKNKKRCYVFCADCRFLPFKDHLFDFVYMNDVLEHMHNIRNCFEEIYRVLKPEGFFSQLPVHYGKEAQAII